MTIEETYKKLSSLFQAGQVRREVGEQEFEILDYSQSAFDGVFSFGRFGEADFVVVKLGVCAVMDAAKELGYIDTYDDRKETVRPDWEGRDLEFDGWYADVVCEELVSRAIYNEVRDRLTAMLYAPKLFLESVEVKPAVA